MNLKELEMAIQQFLSALRAARDAVFGQMHEATDAGQPANNLSFIEAATRTADIWLTPDLVKGYAEADFSFLPPDKQKELRSAVVDFRCLTDGLRGGIPSVAQINEGYDLFEKINNITAPHPEDPDLKRIAEATRLIPWPEYVLWVNFRLGTDSTGDPAVWIILALKDDVEIESPGVQAELATVREAFRETIQKAGINRWPYITVRTRSDVQALVGGGV